MPIPPNRVSGDSGHIQDHNDIASVLTGYETRIDQLESDFDLLPASTDIATESYVDSAVTVAVNNLINSAPSALNTLDELAAALGDDANFATTVTNSLSQKQPLDADLTAIAGLSATSGLLRKTASDTWTLDTTNFAATSYVDSAISTALNSYLPLAGGGGGGGANAVGGNAGSPTAEWGGAGGAGRSSSITGTAVTRAGGGSGSRYTAGGTGGGGQGSNESSPGGNGVSNTGGGGGGACNAAGGNGGSGVIIIKVPNTNTLSFTAGVTFSLITSVSGFNIYQITAAGLNDRVTII